MDNTAFKNETIPLPAGYYGLRDNGNGFDNCEAASIVRSYAFNGVDDCPVAVFIHFCGVDGEILDYLITKRGKVTDGASTWLNLPTFLSGASEMDHYDGEILSEYIMKGII